MEVYFHINRYNLTRPYKILSLYYGGDPPMFHGKTSRKAPGTAQRRTAEVEDNVNRGFQPGQSPAAATLMNLQQSVGNQAVQRMLADHPAQLLAAAGPLQRAPMEEEEELQMKKTGTLQRAAMPEEEELQMKREHPIQKKGKMPEEVQAKMENAFGADFSNVRIHEGNEAPSVGALAYTQGENIHFAPGRYNPESPSGQELLGHELTHVVQQREGRVEPTTQINGLGVNDEVHLEREADHMGAKAARS